MERDPRNKDTSPKVLIGRERFWGAETFGTLGDENQQTGAQPIASLG